METIKEEKKADLEQLLNSLIEKGWKPFGINYYCSFNIRKRIEILGGPFGGGEYMLEKISSLRELVSKDSGLWQFVCENGMVKKNKWIGRFKEHLDTRDGETKEDWEFDMGCAEYYIIESSLKDESELEDFLLSNIKVEG